MTQSPAMAATLDGYQLRLPSFEGPLDVLLRLIERDQLAISEISLLAVFDQFMARPARAQEEPEEVDLVRQLEAYRAVKAAAELLAVRQRSGSGAFGRGEAVSGPPIEPIRFPPQPPSALVEAVGRWLTRVPAKPALLPRHRAVSLREMISRISAALNHEASISFSRIRATCISPQDTAVAFLAILTLMRRQTVIASQNELFGPIELARGLFVPHSSDEPMDRDLDGTDGDSRHRT
ncbi:MAG: chromosome segregation and condensation protein ScpA [Thermomicrobiales bacterium]|nr:chromosome segregation and condensation protein ScpA [Thermomicrobiales bacterium]